MGRDEKRVPLKKPAWEAKVVVTSYGKAIYVREGPLAEKLWGGGGAGEFGVAGIFFCYQIRCRNFS